MISVVTCTVRDQMMANVLNNYRRQTLANKELIVVLNKDDIDINVWKAMTETDESITIYKLPENISVGECKNFAVLNAKYPFIAKFDDDDYYAPLYLESGYHAFQKKEAVDIVGKSTVFYYFKKYKLLGLFSTLIENNYTDFVTDSTLIFKKDIIDAIPFTNRKVGSDRQFQKDCRLNGLRVFSTDRYNHTVIRSGIPSDHTWKMDDLHLMKFCSNMTYTKDFESLIIKND